MPQTWLDNLTPQALTQLAWGARGVLLAGLVLWLFGIGIAHLLAVLILGAIGASLAIFAIPQTGWDISPLSCGIIGFVLGAAIGGLTFRIMQALLLAVCLGLAVATVYYTWHIMPTSPLPLQSTTATIQSTIHTLATQHAPTPAELANSLLHPQPQLVDLRQKWDQLLDQWHSLDRHQYYRMAIAGIGSAIAALLFALTFSRFTTILITSLLGSLLIQSSALTLARAYIPTHISHWPTHPPATYALLAILTLVGTMIQYRIFPRSSDKASKKTPSQKPAEA